MSNSNSKNVPSKLCTPNDLSDKAIDAIAESLNGLVADTFSLYVKTKNFHWHMSGSHYRDYHLLMDEQAEQIFAMIDVLAERVRKLGKTTIRSIGHIHQLQTIQDDNDDFVEPREMIKRLMEDNRAFTKSLRSAHEVCSEGKDYASTSILEIYIDETERRVWFLFETYSI